MSRVDAIIVTYNSADAIEACVAPLLEADAHVVVVDNASRDDSVAAAGSVASRCPGRVTVIPLNHNAGAVARNVGVARCSTPYVAFCDDDSWWAPEAPAIGTDLFAPVSLGGQ